MERWIVFGILSIFIVLLSWKTLFRFRSHGFYRFFSWECMAWLLVSNIRYWFDHPFSLAQLFSWFFLFFSVYLVLAGALQLKKYGKPVESREDENLYGFEKTSVLVDRGIYKYIRHPLYSSLMFLTWGILLKNITLSLLLVSVLSTVFLYLTAVADEKECISYFGNWYRDYMKRSKRFVPFLV